jgi:hypothetical protein
MPEEQVETPGAEGPSGEAENPELSEETLLEISKETLQDLDSPDDDADKVRGGTAPASSSFEECDCRGGGVRG